MRGVILLSVVLFGTCLPAETATFSFQENSPKIRKRDALLKGIPLNGEMRRQILTESSATTPVDDKRKDFFRPFSRRDAFSSFASASYALALSVSPENSKGPPNTVTGTHPPDADGSNDPLASFGMSLKGGGVGSVIGGNDGILSPGQASFFESPGYGDLGEAGPGNAGPATLDAALRESAKRRSVEPRTHG